jgi:hypothetical protein
MQLRRYLPPEIICAANDRVYCPPFSSADDPVRAGAAAPLFYSLINRSSSPAIQKRARRRIFQRKQVPNTRLLAGTM